MGVDVALGATAAVAAQGMADQVERGSERVAERHALKLGEVEGQNLQRARQVRRVPLSGHIAFAKPDRAGSQDAVNEAIVADDHPTARPAILSIEAEHATVRQLKVERAKRPVSRHDPGDRAERHGRTPKIHRLRT